MADAALAALGVYAHADLDLGTVTAVENPGNGDGMITAGEGARLTVQLNNSFGQNSDRHLGDSDHLYHRSHHHPAGRFRLSRSFPGTE